MSKAATHVDYLYCELTERDYLLIPHDMLTARTTTFTDTPRSKYQPYKNTFSAFTDALASRGAPGRSRATLAGVDRMIREA
jgi:hypothetical protein